MNTLETAVQKAATEPAFRNEFYRIFLESQIFIPHGNTPDELQIDDGRLRVGVNLKLPSIPADGQNWLPVFSSVENLSKAITAETQYVQLRGRDFLEMVRGAHVVLNPGVDYGKQFVPEEIEAMLSGDVFRPDYGQSIRSIKTEKPEKILLGQPKQYPHKLVDALKREFSRHPQVKRAYLAHGIIPSQGVSPHTMIGIEAEDYAAVVRLVEPMLKTTVAQHQIVDFVPIQAGHSIAEYMVNSTQPFYVTSRPSFWKRLFGR